LTFTENFTEIVPGDPSAGGVKHKRGIAKYNDFGPIDGYISETVQDIGGKLVLIIVYDLSIGTKIGDLE